MHHQLSGNGCSEASFSLERVIGEKDFLLRVVLYFIRSPKSAVGFSCSSPAMLSNRTFIMLSNSGCLLIMIENRVSPFQNVYMYIEFAVRGNLICAQMKQEY